MVRLFSMAEIKHLTKTRPLQRLGSTGLLSILMLQATLLAVPQDDQRPGYL